MKLVYSPQRADIPRDLSVDGDVITVTIGGVTDVFDFTGMPDGVTDGVESILTHSPILRAERVAGELTVHLLHWYGADAAEDEKQVREVIV